MACLTDILTITSIYCGVFLLDTQDTFFYINIKKHDLDINNYENIIKSKERIDGQNIYNLS